MRIVVLGAGAWGTALAVSAQSHNPAGHRVTLWARDPAQRQALERDRENRRYLPGVPLPVSLALSSDPLDSPSAAWREADLVVLATPMSALRAGLIALQDAQSPVVWLSKGFEAPATEGALGLLGHEVAAAVAPRLACGVLSGPSFALEVGLGQPTALVAAARDAAVSEAMVSAFHGPSLRVYANADVVGVEVGGAVKNVLAIAAGVLDGLADSALPDAVRPGLNARAALITRGLAEMTRLGLALGARPDTFMGLSGLGDLVLTATGQLSRNRRVGLCLAQGQTLAQAVESLGHVAEGVYTARTVWDRAQHLGVDMPITAAVVALLEGRLQPAEAVAILMGRGPRGETH